MSIVPKTFEAEKNCLETTVRPANGQINLKGYDLKLKNPRVGSRRLVLMTCFDELETTRRFVA